MSGFLDKLEEYFDTRDFYEALKIERTATTKEIKKAYHKLSLLVHPDRVEESRKKEATEKFKVLGRIHSILQDDDKRKIYDETGEFDEEGDSTCDWLKYWLSMFKKITISDIQKYEKEYIGSDTEKRDIKKAYLSKQGDMNRVLEMVPFSSCDSEPRIIEIVRQMVDDGEVEEYPKFFNEPKSKKLRRRRKWEAEKKEAEKIDIDEFQKEISERRQQRASEFASFIDKLESKYQPSKKRKSLKDSDSTEYKPPTKKRPTRARASKN